MVLSNRVLKREWLSRSQRYRKIGYYFALNIQAAVTNGTGNTETDMIRLLTVANQQVAYISEVLGGAYNFTTVGGLSLRLRAFTTPSTSGSSATPTKRNQNNPTAQTTAFTLPTPGSTALNHMSVGLSQTGGMGGWQALEPDATIQLLPNGGANGNLDLFSIATTASVPFDYTLSFREA